MPVGQGVQPVTLPEKAGSQRTSDVRPGSQTQRLPTFKHLRNIAPSIGKRHRRHPDEREAFLGHAVKGTGRFYEGDVDQTCLVDLVNLIGGDYFDGETVKA